MHAPRLILPLALAAVAVLAACGGAQEPAEPAATDATGATSAAAPPATSAATTAEPAITAVPSSIEAADVVLRVTVDGGFVPVEYALRTLPTYTLYEDGSVIVPGPVPELYPGPARLPLLAGRIELSEVQAVLDRARAAGLLEEPTVPYGDMGSVGISDAPTTTLTVTADGATRTHAAYALAMDVPTNGMPAEIAKARKTLADFIAALPQPAAMEPYVSAKLRVYIGPYSEVPDMPQPPVTWPLDAPLASAGTAADGFAYRCLPVEGDDAAALLAALDTANDLSPWVVSETTNATFRVLVRPLLPDERGCPAA